MPGLISRRLFPILQLTRMALVFTAISNSLCEWLLWMRLRGPGPVRLSPMFWKQAILVALISTGMYGFGMSLNDIIDRRRDRQLAAHRPLPSGRIGVRAAHFVCAMLIAMACICGFIYARWSGQWMSLALIGLTAGLIIFYDSAGKYLVAMGLLTLGLIRFFHAVIPAPQLPLVWHPLLLLNHVTILSLVAYRWEEKRPSLTPAHWWAVPGVLVLIDGLVIWLMAERRMRDGASFAEALHVTPALIAPACAMAAFILLGWLIRRRSASSREAGQRLMLYGLLWLIIYDFTFACGYVSLLSASVLLLLLPLAYASVQVMRWWGGIVALSQRPSFRRVEC